MSDQKHDKLEIYLLNNFGLIYAYINDLQNSLFSLSYPWTFCTQSIYTQFESFLPEPVVDSHRTVICSFSDEFDHVNQTVPIRLSPK